MALRCAWMVVRMFLRAVDAGAGVYVALSAGRGSRNVDARRALICVGVRECVCGEGEGRTFIANPK
jgi:hypothetical protein